MYTQEEVIRARLKEHFPKLRLLSVGRSIDVYKDVGTPAEIAERYRFRELSGSSRMVVNKEL